MLFFIYSSLMVKLYIFVYKIIYIIVANKVKVETVKKELAGLFGTFIFRVSSFF